MGSGVPVRCLKFYVFLIPREIGDAEVSTASVVEPGKSGCHAMCHLAPLEKWVAYR